MMKKKKNNNNNNKAYIRTYLAPIFEKHSKRRQEDGQ
jgi:hypothetical protein